MLELTDVQWIEIREAVFSITGSQDIVQEVCLYLVGRDENLGEIANVKAYAMTAARRSLSKAQQRAKRTISFDVWLSDHGDNTELPDVLIDYDNPETQYLDKEEKTYQASVLATVRPRESFPNREAWRVYKDRVRASIKDKY